MKRIIKKLFISLFVVMMAFTFFACTKTEEPKESDKITVTYATNGGTEIQATEVSLDELSTFVLPTNPSKEGYVFKGWFTDEAFTNEFKNVLSLTESLTLYAKWEPKEDKDSGENDNPSETKSSYLNFTTTCEVAMTLTNTENSEATKYEGKIKVDAIVPTTSVEALKDFTAKFVVNGNYGEEKLLGGTVTVYIYDGYVYLSIPMNKTSMKLKVSLDQVLEALYKALEEKAGDFGFDLDDYIGSGSEDITESLDGILDDFEVPEELVSALTGLLTLLLPTAKEEGNKVTYSYTQEQFEALVDGIVSVITDNAEIIKEYVNAIIELISSFIGEPEEDEDPEVSEEESTTCTDGDGNVFSKDKAGYTDSNGQFHEFSSDNYELVGYYDEYYNVLYVDILESYFDCTAKKYLSFEEYMQIVRSKDYVDYDGNVFTYNKNTYKDSTGVEHSLSEDFEAQNFGYVDEYTNTYYLYCFGQAFDLETLKPLTDEEYDALYDFGGIEFDIDEIIEMIPEYAQMIKSMLKINELKLEKVTGEDGELTKATLTVDVEVTMEMKIASKQVITYTVNSIDESIDTSELGPAYLDYTYMIVEYIENMFAAEELE